MLQGIFARRNKINMSPLLYHLEQGDRLGMLVTETKSIICRFGNLLVECIMNQASVLHQDGS